jgi:hypothetical protein
MSTETFPTLPGLEINVKKKALWDTKVQTSRAGKELRSAWRSRPRYEYTLTFWLRQGNAVRYVGKTELRTLVDFYNRMKGAFDVFYFADPDDGTVRVCRFKDDGLEVERFTGFHWKTSGIHLIEVI